MAGPIILWNPSNTQREDLKTGFIDSVLPTPPTYTPTYRCGPTHWQPRNFKRVPKLTSFCIRVLCEYPEQLHQLGPLRLHYDSKEEEEDGTDAVLRSLLPSWGTRDFSLLSVDPRLWATIIQVYRNPPDILSSYPCPLSDPYVPLLNQIPCTPDFALLTVLDLEGCKDITDDNILSLKVLHNLTALDLSCCSALSARSIQVLSRTLAFNEYQERRGPWALRILRMRSCHMVDRRIFKSLHAFPLLSVIDLRNTRCAARDIERPFFSTTEDSIFGLPLAEAVNYLSDAHRFMFSTERPFVLSLQERLLHSRKRPLRRATTSTVLSQHNSFVVLPPSQGSTSSIRPGGNRIQFGNIETNEFLEKRFERDARIRRYERQDYDDHDSDYSSGHGSICQCDSCLPFYDRLTYGDFGEAEEDGEEDEEDEEQEGDVDRDELFDPPPNSSVNANDSDNQLLSALQESLRQVPQAVTSNSSPTTTRRGGSNITAASVDNFYRQWTTPPPPRQIKLPNSELALLRVPPVWQTLDAVKPRATHSGGARKATHNLGEATLSVKRKQNASMQLLQGELSKRRRVTSVVDTSDVTPGTPRGLSPPPSPTSTVCDTREMDTRRAPPLRPVSNLQPPPRSSFLKRPRLKLEPTAKTVETFSKPASQSLAIPKRRTNKARNTSLTEGFRVQSQKLSTEPATGLVIKPTTTKERIVTGGNRDSSFKGSRQKNGKYKGAGTTAEPKAGGFNWDSWRRR